MGENKQVHNISFSARHGNTRRAGTGKGGAKEKGVESKVEAGRERPEERGRQSEEQQRKATRDARDAALAARGGKTAQFRPREKKNKIKKKCVRKIKATVKKMT